MVYASRGMFVPRGTDTVPAMLTPGEFVVNRSAVNRGNNLAMLTAMNAGMGIAGGGRAMSRGGVVYAADGGLMGFAQRVQAAYGSSFAGALDNLPSIADNFAQKLKDGAVNGLIGITDPLKNILNEDGRSFVDGFQQAVTNLANTDLAVKVDPTNVTVTINGGNFLSGLKDDVRNELIDKIREELGNAKFTEAGSLRSGR